MKRFYRDDGKYYIVHGFWGFVVLLMTKKPVHFFWRAVPLLGGWAVGTLLGAAAGKVNTTTSALLFITMLIISVILCIDGALRDFKRLEILGDLKLVSKERT
jgi:hypothetical protein